MSAQPTRYRPDVSPASASILFAAVMGIAAITARLAIVRRAGRNRISEAWGCLGLLAVIALLVFVFVVSR